MGGGRGRCSRRHRTCGISNRTTPLPKCFERLSGKVVKRRGFYKVLRQTNLARRQGEPLAPNAYIVNMRRDRKRSRRVQQRGGTIESQVKFAIRAAQGIRGLSSENGVSFNLTAANFTGFGARTARCCRRQADNRFARTTCRRATSCTDDTRQPTIRTARRRCSALHLPRGRRAADSRPVSSDSPCFDIDPLLIADPTPRQRGSLRGKNSIQGLGPVRRVGQHCAAHKAVELKFGC